MAKPRPLSTPHRKTRISSSFRNKFWAALRDCSVALQDNPCPVKPTLLELSLVNKELYAPRVPPHHLSFSIGVNLKEQLPIRGASPQPTFLARFVAARVPAIESMGNQLSFELRITRLDAVRVPSDTMNSAGSALIKPVVKVSIRFPLL